MASGHVNRISRPNTWLHRPMLLREVLTCQPGAVHTWHDSEVPPAAKEGRSRLQSGLWQSVHERVYEFTP